MDDEWALAVEQRLADHGDKVKVGDRTIDMGEPVYVIAEIGGNHDGNLEQAERLIHAAAEAGADCAKFQLFNPDTLYPGRHTEGAIPESWLHALQEICGECGVEFLCSVFDLELLAVYQELHPAAVKIASPEAVNEELLEAASSLPMLVSTGALDWKGTDRVNGVLAALDAEYVLLHCVSAYPAHPAELNLAVIAAMRERYGVNVGFSDHTTLVSHPAWFAAAAGACVLEKHLTMDSRSLGPDHPFALEPDQFKAYVVAARSVAEWLGDGVKCVQPSEDATDRRAA